MVVRVYGSHCSLGFITAPLNVGWRESEPEGTLFGSVLETLQFGKRMKKHSKIRRRAPNMGPWAFWGDSRDP